jgi:hypothetical protein
LKAKASRTSLWRKLFVWTSILREEKPVDDPDDLFLKNVRNFDEWLAYVKEKDPRAYQELIDLSKEPMTRRRVKGSAT